MKKLELNQMADVSGGGCGEKADRAIAILGLISGIGAAFGPIGLAIAGPTALGMGVMSVFCAFR